MQEQLKALPISDIYPNPFQPRIEFSDEELAELSQSISENGLIQPIIVRKSDIIGYELIAGERRLRACKTSRNDRNPCSCKGSYRSRKP